MRTIVPLLEQLGLNDKESKIYLSLLEFGPANITQIALKSGIKRTTVYSFLDTLKNRSFIIETAVGGRKLYDVADPKELERVIEKQKDIVNQITPDLNNILGQREDKSKPKVRFYEGVEGIKKVYEDTLNQPSGSEILAYAGFEEAYRIIPESFLKSYVKRRVKKKISARGLLPFDSYSKIHIKENKKELRKTIALPADQFPMTNEINIYQNKVAIMSFQKDKIGIIIESEEIASNQRIVFNLLWDALKKK
ncbi:MAG TPA: helix-turn-helix domain-containing protein [Patescibacteria group bacterium]|nr:helix-turn-helix domain-containing protein [Patescibacteria group bacterium]